MSNAAKWCIALGAILKDKDLTDQERENIQGTKKAMERVGYRVALAAGYHPPPILPGGINGA